MTMPPLSAATTVGLGETGDFETRATVLATVMIQGARTSPMFPNGDAKPFSARQGLRMADEDLAAEEVRRLRENASPGDTGAEVRQRAVQFALAEVVADRLGGVRGRRAAGGDDDLHGAVGRDLEGDLADAGVREFHEARGRDSDALVSSHCDTLLLRERGFKIFCERQRDAYREVGHIRDFIVRWPMNRLTDAHIYHRRGAFAKT